MYQILRTLFSSLFFQPFGFGFLGTLIENKNQNYCVANEVLVKKKRDAKIILFYVSRLLRPLRATLNKRSNIIFYLSLLHYHFFRVLHTEQRDSVSCYLIASKIY